MPLLNHTAFQCSQLSSRFCRDTPQGRPTSLPGGRGPRMASLRQQEAPCRTRAHLRHN